MTIIIRKSDLSKQVVELSSYQQHQFQILCRDKVGEKQAKSLYTTLSRQTITDLRKVSGLGLDRVLAVLGEIR